MILPFHVPAAEYWAVLRRRMLHETEIFLEQGLRHPEQCVRIPAIPVGKGAFTAGFARAFWERALGAA